MKDQSSRKTYTIIFTTVITIVWIVSVIFAFSKTKVCGDSGNIYFDRLACLAANELGDMIAGAFSPLAFLWLVAAVLLQKAELEAQRQDLRESRLVALQQVEEARKNVELIDAQTKIMNSQFARDERNAVDSDIKEILLIIRREVVERAQTAYVGHRDLNHENLIQATNVARIRHSDMSDEFDYIQNVFRGIAGMDFFARQVVEVGDGDLRSSDIEAIDRIGKLVSRISELSVNASEPMKANLERIGLHSMPSLISTLTRFVRENAKYLTNEHGHVLRNKS